MERARYNTGPSIQNNNINLSNFWGALQIDALSALSDPAHKIYFRANACKNRKHSFFFIHLQIIII